MLIRNVALVCVFGIVLLRIAGVSADEAWFTGIGDLPGSWFESYAYGVSGDGSTVVGMGKSQHTEWSAYEAAYWTRVGGIRGMGDLKGPPLISSYARAASWDGNVIVGGAESTRGGEAFRWTRQTGMMGLGTLERRPSHAYGISGDGNVVVGWYKGYNGMEKPFRWTPEAGMEKLRLPFNRSAGVAYAVSDDGAVVVGTTGAGQGAEAFRWENGESIALGMLPGHESSDARAVSADGRVVVGFGWDDGHTTTGFRWTAEEGMVSLGSISGEGPGSAAYGISADSSVIVGYGEEVGGADVAAIWTEATGWRRLDKMLEQEYGLDLGVWRLVTATGVSADGLTIVGWGISENGYEGWVAHIPEPATALPTSVVAVLLARAMRRSIGK
jgi:probable HAF family extracellular repeat protein